jgi:hypothetical protein
MTEQEKIIQILRFISQLLNYYHGDYATNPLVIARFKRLEALISELEEGFNVDQK